MCKVNTEEREANSEGNFSRELEIVKMSQLEILEKKIIIEEMKMV
jgi:hypothetical protein